MQLQRLAGNAAVAAMLTGYQVQRTPTRTSVEPKTSKVGPKDPDEPSEDIKKLGPEGIRDEGNRVSDAIDYLYDQTSNGLDVFKGEQAIKNVKKTSWIKELVIEAMVSAVGGFVAGWVIQRIEHTAENMEHAAEKIAQAKHLDEKTREGLAKGIEGAVSGFAKGAVGEGHDLELHPIVAFVSAERETLSKAKLQTKDNFHNNVLPGLELDGRQNPGRAPQLIGYLEKLRKEYRASAESAVRDQFNKTLDAWNWYTSRVKLGGTKPGERKQATDVWGDPVGTFYSGTDLSDVVTAAGPIETDEADYFSHPTPGVLFMDGHADSRLENIRVDGWRVYGLNESLRNAFAGRVIRDVRMPHVVNLDVDHHGTVAIGRNVEGSIFGPFAPRNLWAYLYIRAVPELKGKSPGEIVYDNLAQTVREGARKVIEEDIGSQVIKEVKQL